MSTNSTLIDDMKRKTAETAVEKYVKRGMVVGLGTGSTASFAIIRIGSLVASGWEITGIPTSVASENLARKLGIKLSTIEEYPEIDVTIDGADEVDPFHNLIKGMGGALLREKIIAESTRKEIIVVDETKIVKILGSKSPLPIEVVPFGYEKCRNQIKKLSCNPKIRMKDNDFYKTDNHNYILDCEFHAIQKPRELDAKLHEITGVVETGLFIDLVDAVIIARKNDIEIQETP